MNKMKNSQVMLIAALAMSSIGCIVDDPFVEERPLRSRNKPEPAPFRPTHHTPHQGKKEIARRLKQMQKGTK